MLIKITVAQLKSLNACSQGVDDFLSVYPSSEAEIEWTRDSMIAMLRTPLHKWIGWAYRNNILPYWSLRNADLGDANLRDADLRGANLYSANLSAANLSDADLRDADLRDANLRDASLYSADLSGANLRGATYCHHTILPDGIDKSSMNYIDD